MSQKPTSGEGSHLTPAQQTREMLESFAVALILMLLMRTCLGENYQIPTGSMAPTLQGRHMDLVCPQCHYQYRTGASVENSDSPQRDEVIASTCPICRFSVELDKKADPNQRSFAGDRIIVSKLAYLLAPPERWDVIVFKCPANAKVNYIKRLVGLPGEELVIYQGDIFTLDPATANEPPDRQRFRIARKPPEKLLSMLQLVDDTRHIGDVLRKYDWPSRWVSVSTKSSGQWRQSEAGSEFAVDAGEGESWLRYRHLTPRPEDWSAMKRGEKPDLARYQGMLITDYYAYNDFRLLHQGDPSRSTEATNWVGDLALEGDFEVLSSQGQVLLDLVEGGIHFQCRIDVAAGTATLSTEGNRVVFQGEQGQGTDSVVGSTRLRGPGSYHLRFANVDDQLFLWVNDELVIFDGPTTFEPPADLQPRWSPEDRGDLMPVGIGARQARLHVSSLRILRDVYYVAVSMMVGGNYAFDYDGFSPDEIHRILREPESWQNTELFRSRRRVEFTMEDDEYFPLGDNSPQSQDARLWSSYLLGGKPEPPAAVHESLMIGKALLVYWPHAWYVPVAPVWPIVPNFQRIGFIR